VLELQPASRVGRSPPPCWAMLGPLCSPPERIGREVRAEMEYPSGLFAEDRDEYLPGQAAPIRLSVADGPKWSLVGLRDPMTRIPANQGGSPFPVARRKSHSAFPADGPRMGRATLKRHLSCHSVRLFLEFNQIIYVP